MSDAASTTPWWGRGLLFENCSCTTICPGHVHFDQLCTHERCIGYWAMRFDDGAYGDVSLAGVRAVIAYDTPQHMIEGGWVQAFILDRETTPGQRQALETIFTGAAGGPWQVLARFVDERLPTRYLPIRIEEDGKVKRLSIEGLLEASIEEIRGRDRSAPVRFENMFNQIHAASQVIATGSTRYDDGRIVIHNEKTHGLHSKFHWSVGR